MSIADWKPGTAIANNLKLIGITPESYQQMKEAVGLPGECNCKQREEWLNRAWQWAFAQGKTPTAPTKRRPQSWRNRCSRRRRS